VISGFLIKRVSVIAWALVGLLAIVFFSPMSISEGHEYGSMVVRLLAPLGMGLVGLMVGGLMAALMSTVSAHMIAAAATFTENVYKPSMSGRSDRHYMLVGRVASAVFLVTTALVAFAMRDVVGQYVLSFEALATFGPVFWLGFVWRRANYAGALAGIFTGMVVFFLLPVLACFTSLSTQRDLLTETKPAIIRYENQVATQYDVDEGRAAQVGQVFSFTKEGESVPVFFTGLKDEDGHRRGSGRLRPVVYVMYLLGVPVETFSPALFKSIQLVFPALAPFLVMLILSRCTRRVPKPILDDFYARMLTPAMGKPPEEDAKEVAENAADFDTRMASHQLFPASDWVIPRPNRFTVVGFFVVCAISLSLLGCLWLMAAGLRGWST
jgi:SSS family solute:Na+ symporter